ncbi:MAG: hypothetical protein Q7S48_05180 [bacterium]|nr:hypothetical protein [bacterium]
MWLPILLILVITGSVWALNKFLPFKFCPVCAGVSGTWTALTALMLADILPTTFYILPTAILMGGTVVGIAYQGEKSLVWVKSYPVAWKLAVMVVGFPLAYGAVQYMSWTIFGLELVVLALLMYVFFFRRVAMESHVPHSNGGANVKKIEKGLESCC